MKLTPVILCGGFGSRLWPASRLAFPKPCLTLADEDLSLLQQTLIRIAHLKLNAPIVVCNQSHRFIIAQQIEALKESYAFLKDTRIILEPSARNTAPAIALAALEANYQADNSHLLVLPADHVIRWDTRFDSSIQNAFTLAESNHLVTFGIKPTRAETSFGYIKSGENYDVIAFIEKPNIAKATEYLTSENYLWNSGMFVFNATRYLTELERLSPDIFQACSEAFAGRKENEDFIRIDETAFNQCPADSIDYAVMEKTKDAKVVPFYCDWQDLGSWSAVYNHLPKDKNNNLITGDVISKGSQHCLIKSESRLVATLGLENMIIVETSDAVLVMNKAKSQQMGELIESLKKSGRSEYLVKKLTE